MSFATESLAKAQAAYHAALDAQESVRFGDREIRRRKLAELLDQVKYWQAQVDAENGRAVGKPSRAPLRFRL